MSYPSLLINICTSLEPESLQYRRRSQSVVRMVCAKCQKLQKKTELATPGVKRRNEMYYGSPASSTTSAGDKSRTSATLGTTGIGKVSKPLRSHDEIKTDIGFFHS